MIEKPEGEHPEYLGDGVTASFDGYQIWLETEREGSVIHKIALEPKVFRNLIAYSRMCIEWPVKSSV